MQGSKALPAAFSIFLMIKIPGQPSPRYVPQLCCEASSKVDNIMLHRFRAILAIKTVQRLCATTASYATQGICTTTAHYHGNPHVASLAWGMLMFKV
eukprot:7051399-Ditylum_brightwellii.AAC.1